MKKLILVFLFVGIVLSSVFAESETDGFSYPMRKSNATIYGAYLGTQGADSFVSGFGGGFHGKSHLFGTPLFYYGGIGVGYPANLPSPGKFSLYVDSAMGFGYKIVLPARFVLAIGAGISLFLITDDIYYDSNNMFALTYGVDILAEVQYCITEDIYASFMFEPTIDILNNGGISFRPQAKLGIGFQMGRALW